MDSITLPVVAHRLFGFGYRQTGTAWSRGPLDPQIVKPAPDPPEIPLFGSSMHSGIRYHTRGTELTVEQIRDLFDRGQLDSASGDSFVNYIWRQAGIRFKLLAVVDHAIRSDHAVLMESEAVETYARKLNWSGVINFYVTRELDSARGMASFSFWPSDRTKRPAYALIEDWPRTYMLWDTFVAIAAHELGHVLTLRHDELSDNLMNRSAKNTRINLRGVQVAVARDHAARYLTEARRLSAKSPVFRSIYQEPNAAPLVIDQGTMEPWAALMPAGEQRR
jgi:hypothetical protein